MSERGKSEMSTLIIPRCGKDAKRDRGLLQSALTRRCAPPSPALRERGGVRESKPATKNVLTDLHSIARGIGIFPVVPLRRGTIFLAS